ncbi:MAG: pirin family protein [Flavobacteriaceae bacterium]|nr:pirin family protein [Flavobacteriaceae bacterium]
MNKTIKTVYGYKNIDGLIPGINGQRAFPTREFIESDPFVMLDHIGPKKMEDNWFLDGKGHDHPHRGFETITIMFEGNMQHRDSLGNKAQLNSGSVQRMNAGSGIIHGGDMRADSKTKRFHEMQLWVNNPSVDKMSQPDIHNVSDKEIPSSIVDNMELKVFSGEINGLKGPITTKAKTQIAHLVSKGKGEIKIGEFPKGNNVMIYVLEGSVYINNTEIEQYKLVSLSENGNSIIIKTSKSAQVMILSGKPLNETVVYGGPFVMNTQQEINQANIDFSQGKFGQIQY